MNVYVFHSRLFGSPRIMTTNFPISKIELEKMANWDNNYPDENKWKLTEASVFS